MPRKTKTKKVDKRWTVEERREDIKNLLREFGLWSMPSYRQLAERYNCGKTMIGKDMDKIVSTFDPKEINQGFTEFLNANQKAQGELRKILRKGSFEQKLKAIAELSRLEKTYIDLLEKYGKKKKVPDPIEIRGSFYDKRLEEIYEKYHGKGKNPKQGNKK